MIRGFLTVWGTFLLLVYVTLWANWPDAKQTSPRQVALAMQDITKATCTPWKQGKATCYVHYNHQYKRYKIEVTKS